MVLTPLQTYHHWRSAALTTSFLQETKGTTPPERLLQLIWQHQRLRHDALLLSDGQTLSVLHPGFWNRAAGPDFRKAVLRIGDAPPQIGDVEIDIRAADWQGHRHGGNPAYRNVILHVLWENPSAASTIPSLPLQPHLDAPLDELIAWIDLDPGPPDNVIGRCANGFRRLPLPTLIDVLHHAALFRFHRKGLELAARARQAGWEQALWEALFGALGYSVNYWPMRRLAEDWASAAPASLESSRATPLEIQAHLFGRSGLLPHESADPDPQAQAHLRQLWDCWWRERAAAAPLTLPKDMWCLAGLRPANRPERRLALAAHWLHQGDLPLRIEKWFAMEFTDAQLPTALLAELRIEPDPFWARHWTLSSNKTPRPQPLLGLSRTTDLAINVILPWLWIRAKTGTNEPLQQRAESRYLAWPAAQDNAILRLARSRLWAGISDDFAWTSARQQGLLQLVRDFCGHSNALCERCTLPDSLRSVC